MENPRLPKRMTQTKTLIQQAETDLEVVIRARCLLFNDDYHTFDEVIEQLMLAIRCSARRAEEMAWQVHNQGYAVVHVGALEDCLDISAILGEIDLRTEVQL
ncbi:MAG TPA: ATP-dependent Clp protease adaptor ClpS [Chitinophagales bacterium]|nr:ATP-dependent Clp protease adaptor ClpS [Chitinophagales bacterium]